MIKHIHEIRDPIHVFIKLDSAERNVLDSRPFQRLRHIHQLAMTYLVYPGASHKRFEHSLGVEFGGMQSAEALLLARYFMFSQVYLHPVRRIYDIHLKDFLEKWLESGKFPTNPAGHLTLTDNEIIAAIREICNNKGNPGFEHAARIINRKHFKLLYQRNPEDLLINPDASKVIFAAAIEKFGKERAKLDSYKMKGGLPNFPIILTDERILSSLDLSKPLFQLPAEAIDYVFIDPDIFEQAKKWLKRNRNDIITLKKIGGTK